MFNGVVAVISHSFAEFGSFGTNDVTLVEVGPVLCDKNVTLESPFGNI